MKEKIEQAAIQLKKEIENINDLEGMKQIRAKYFTNSELLQGLKQEVRTAENKSEIGKFINLYNTSINEIINNKKEELENKFDLEERENPILNSKAEIIGDSEGVTHPLTKIVKIVTKFFDNLGYEYEHGLEIEDEEINFDRLNIPSDHPARTMQDTFYLEAEGKLLRTHSTNITARHLEKTTNENLKAYSIGTVFRNDENDATHSFQFNQVDIFRIGKDISVADLK
jgi:phenylalanyl-tRNA synthetase alpha chain